MVEQPTIKTHREVVKKDNFFSVEVKEGEQVTMAVNGEIVINAYVPTDCSINCYMKRKPVMFGFAHE